MSGSAGNQDTSHREQHSWPPADVSGVLAVVAHPDDESFALGALLDRLASSGVSTSVLCFTRGEASTLNDGCGELTASHEDELAAIRGGELRAAAAELGIASVELLDYPDGRLGQFGLDELAGHIGRLIAVQNPSHLLVFDSGGVTGHPDHQQATAAAVAAARTAGRTVLAWALPAAVTDQLNNMFGGTFVGRKPDEIDAVLSVSRARQYRAIAAHRSQSLHNPVLGQRLALLRDREHLRVLYRPAQDRPAQDRPARDRPAQGDGHMSYGYSVRLQEPFSAQVVDRVRAALGEQGFGVLTVIDVQATLRAKLGVQMEDYLILGACNPPLARQALDIDRQIGLLLPCNVVVRAAGPDATLVQALDPQMMLQITSQPELKAVADDAASRLHAALDQLSS